MSAFQDGGANESGIFRQEVVDSPEGAGGGGVDVYADWDAVITVPPDKQGAIVDAQMQLVYPSPDFGSNGRGIVVTMTADGAPIAQCGEAAGLNNEGGVGYYGSCVGVVAGGPGDYQMALVIKVLHTLSKNGDSGNDFATDDPFLPGRAAVLDSGDPDDDAIGEPLTPPVLRTVHFHFNRYIVTYY